MSWGKKGVKKEFLQICVRVDGAISLSPGGKIVCEKWADLLWKRKAPQFGKHCEKRQGGKGDTFFVLRDLGRSTKGASK